MMGIRYIDLKITNIWEGFDIEIAFQYLVVIIDYIGNIII